MKQTGTYSTVIPAQWPVSVVTNIPSGDISRNNPSYILAYDGANNLIRVDILVDGTTYRKTLTYDGANNLLTVSSWVRV